MKSTIDRQVKYEVHPTPLQSCNYDAHLNPNEDIIPLELVKKLQAKSSLFDAKKDEANFKSLLAKFL